MKPRWFVAALTFSLFAFSALLVATQLVVQVVDPDVFWHISTGQWVIAHGAVPRTDVFSWIGPELSLRWMPHEWLFDVFMARVHAVAGFPGVFAATALLGGALAVAVQRLTYARTHHVTLSSFVGLFAVLGAMRSVAPRPQIATFLLLALVALCLEHRRWYLALPLVIVGVNIHGGVYPLYLVLFAYYTIPGSPVPLVAAAAATLVQPFGVALLRYPFFAFDNQVKMFQEGQTTVLYREPFLVAALLAMALGVDWRRVPLKDVLFAVAFTALSLSAIRHVPYVFILVVPILAPHLRGIGGESQAIGWPDGVPPSQLRLVLLLPLLAGALVLAVKLPSAVQPDLSYPAGAVAWIKQHHVRRLWNDWGDGGYLIFHGVSPLVDGRADPFTRFFDPSVTVSREYLDSYLLRADIRPFLDRYGVTHLLVPRELRVYGVLSRSADFETVYRDDTDAILVYRRASNNASDTVGSH